MVAKRSKHDNKEKLKIKIIDEMSDMIFKERRIIENIGVWSGSSDNLSLQRSDHESPSLDHKERPKTEKEKNESTAKAIPNHYRLQLDDNAISVKKVKKLMNVTSLNNMKRE